MANHTLPTPFAWGDISLSEVVYVDGIPHTTRRAIGEWLDYADPQNAIDVILGRNKHIETHSVPVKLTGTDGKNYDTFVYHPIGFLLVVMESGQPRAHAMKAAVAEFVWHFAGPRKLSLRDEDLLYKRRGAILVRLEKTKDAFIRQVLVNDLLRVSFELGLSVPDLALLGTDCKQLTLQGV